MAHFIDLHNQRGKLGQLLSITLPVNVIPSRKFVNVIDNIGALQPISSVVSICNVDFEGSKQSNNYSVVAINYEFWQQQ
jgi:hypothetical protein